MTNAPSSRDLISTSLGTAALAALLVFAGPVLDHAAEEYDSALAAQDARADAKAQRRRDIAAQWICGPHAEARWISDKELACRNNNDKVRTVRLAGGTDTTARAKP